MTPEVAGAVVAVSAAVIVATVTGFSTVTSIRRQRALDLLISALCDMGRGTQRRSAATGCLADRPSLLNEGPTAVTLARWVRIADCSGGDQSMREPSQTGPGTRSADDVRWR